MKFPRPHNRWFPLGTNHAVHSQSGLEQSATAAEQMATHHFQATGYPLSPRDGDALDYFPKFWLIHIYVFLYCHLLFYPPKHLSCI